MITRNPSLEYEMALKFLHVSCVSECLHKKLSKLLKKRKLTTIQLISIPEYGQLNATLFDEVRK